MLSLSTAGSFGQGLAHVTSGKKKAHKHKLFCPVGLGTTPGFVPGISP